MLGLDERTHILRNPLSTSSFNQCLLLNADAHDTRCQDAECKDRCIAVCASSGQVLNPAVTRCYCRSLNSPF